MSFYILRHADKQSGDFYNARLRHQDEPLSGKGQQQAAQLPGYFIDKKIAAIYISAYQRTQQTIAPAAERLQLPPLIDERINELDNGRFGELDEAGIQEKYPGEWQAFIDRKTDFRFPEGETGEEAQRRILDFLDEKRIQHGDENVIVVSHDGLIRIMMCAILKLPAYKRWNFQVDYCGVTEIVFQPEYGEWKVVRFNQVIYPDAG